MKINTFKVMGLNVLKQTDGFILVKLFEAKMQG